MTTEKMETVLPECAEDKMMTKEAMTEEIDAPLATFGEVFSFAETFKTRLYLVMGIFWAVIAGLMMPATIYYFSGALRDISAITQEGLDPVLDIVYALMIIGVLSLVSETLQSKWVVVCLIAVPFVGPPTHSFYSFGIFVLQFSICHSLTHIINKYSYSTTLLINFMTQVAFWQQPPTR